MTPVQTLMPSDFGCNDVQIMAGTFDEFSFDDVIQVLGLSRQCLRLLVRQGEAAISEILLKAGQVLEARMSDHRDPATVLRTLLSAAVRGSGLSFAVYHTEPSRPFPPPIAALNDLYDQAKAVSGPAPVLVHTKQQSHLDRSATGAPDTPTLRVDRPAALAPAHVSGIAPMPWDASAHLRDTVRDGVRDALREQVRDMVKEVLREEVREPQRVLLDQVQHQGRMLHTLEGRLQALPQLMATDVRLALAQSDPPKQTSGVQRWVWAVVGVQTVLILGLLMFLALRG